MAATLAAVSVRSILDSFYNVYFLHICLDCSFPQAYVCIVNRLAVNVSSLKCWRESFLRWYSTSELPQDNGTASPHG